MTSSPENENRIFRAFRLAAVSCGIGLAGIGLLSRTSGGPSPAELRLKNPSSTALMEIRRRAAQKKNKPWSPSQTWAPLEAMSPSLVDAVISAEDEGFYSHHGVEWNSLKEALLYDVKTRQRARGGSTITQQLAKNLYLSPSKNPVRKLREMLIARRLEQALPKKRILELYMNVAEWGDGVFGAEAAARAAFHKSAASLTLEEAAAMTAVLPSPRKHSPADGSSWVEKRKAWVLGRMQESGRLPAVLEPPLPREPGTFLETPATAQMPAPEEPAETEEETFSED